MSLFDDTFLAFASPVVEHEFGDTITLTDDTITLTPTASVTSDMMERRREETGLVIVYTRKATLTPSALAAMSGGKPKVGMTAVINGMNYDVEDVSKSGSSMTLSLVRYQLRERSRQNYRGL